MTQKPSSRSDSDRLDVPQIVPGCSVNERNSSPYGPWSSTGTAHQAEATAASSPARQPKLHTSRQSRPPAAASYTSRAAGATSAHAITPAFTPPPASERISANAAGQRQPRGVRRPRCAAIMSQGRAAYASSDTVPRLVNVTVYGLSRNRRPAMTCASPRSAPNSSSISRTAPQAASASRSPSQTRWAIHMGIPSASAAANHGPMGNR
jgi:hypothetical protein